MKMDTPLTEVAQLLPVEAAKVLTGFQWATQESVLRMTRTAIFSLERQGHTLDPIELAAVLTVFVASIAPLIEALIMLDNAIKKDT